MVPDHILCLIKSMKVSLKETLSLSEEMFNLSAVLNNKAFKTAINYNGFSK